MTFDFIQVNESVMDSPHQHHCFSYDSIDTGESPVSGGPAAAMDQPHVIPSQGDLLGDLLNLDLGPPVNVPQVSSMQMGAVDLLGGGLDSLVSLNPHTHLAVEWMHWLNFVKNPINICHASVFLYQWAAYVEQLFAAAVPTYFKTFLKNTIPH